MLDNVIGCFSASKVLVPMLYLVRSLTGEPVLLYLLDLLVAILPQTKEQEVIIDEAELSSIIVVMMVCGADAASGMLCQELLLLRLNHIVHPLISSASFDIHPIDTFGKPYYCLDGKQLRVDQWLKLQKCLVKRGRGRLRTSSASLELPDDLRR